MGGLCKDHHEENAAKRFRRETALKLLDTARLDDQVLGEGPLRDEFYRTQNWWRDISSAINASREHPVLQNETEYAVFWCIGLAELIIDEERECRSGRETDKSTYQYQRRQLWKRFENLESGLMSNGVLQSERCAEIETTTTKRR